MTITLDIPPHLEVKIREYATRGDAAAVHRLLVEALDPIVASLIRSHTASPPDDHTFETLADQLADEFVSYVEPNLPPLSNGAVNRHGLYEDHL